MAGRAQGRSSGRRAFSPRVGRESREGECKAAYWGGCGLVLICVGCFFRGDLGIFVIWQEKGGKKGFQRVTRFDGRSWRRQGIVGLMFVNVS